TAAPSREDERFYTIGRRPPTYLMRGRLTMTLAQRLALLAIATFLTPAAWAGGRLEYNRDVRPILAENCFACHGPDSAARKAGLRLDRAEEATALRNGHAAIVKGNPGASEMVRRISTAPAALRMPPASTGKKLTPQQAATLTRWVAEGAEYEKHWAYIPPVRP